MKEPLPFDAYLFSNLGELENFVSNHEDSFLEDFAKGQKTMMGVVGIWFNSENVKFNYILDSGQHMTDSITNTEFKKFIEKIARIM